MMHCTVVPQGAARCHMALHGMARQCTAAH